MWFINQTCCELIITLGNYHLCPCANKSHLFLSRNTSSTRNQNKNPKHQILPPFPPQKKSCCVSSLKNCHWVSIYIIFFVGFSTFQWKLIGESNPPNKGRALLDPTTRSFRYTYNRRVTSEDDPWLQEPAGGRDVATRFQTKWLAGKVPTKMNEDVYLLLKMLMFQCHVSFFLGGGSLDCHSQDASGISRLEKSPSLNM